MSETPKSKASHEVVDGEGDEEKSLNAKSDIPVIEDKDEGRETWGSKLGYVLTLVGYAVGFGNIWRFPTLMHENGGAAFLIPYTFMLFVEGIPIFFLELAIGQRLRKGALGCWNEISPFLGGLGITCGLTCFFVELYYNTLVAWVLSYLFDSFRADLPWKSCVTAQERVPSTDTHETTKNAFNMTIALECQAAKQTSKYYWYRRVLNVSPSIAERGEFNPWLFMCIMIGWSMVWIILFKGIKSSEKVVYFTALFPYLTLLCFFIGNFFQEGWHYGFTYLLYPDFSKLSDHRVWMKAGTQIFFSLGVGYGCLIVFASYLPSNNNCYKDAVMVSFINCGTSLFAALVIFPILGAQGHRQHNSCVMERKLQALNFLNLLDGKLIGLTNEKRMEYNTKFTILDEDGRQQGLIKAVYQLADSTNIKIPLSTPIAGLTDCILKDAIKDSGGGTGLVFMSFAEAANFLPCPQFWSVLFFVMLLTLGIDSSFGTAEGAIAALMDTKLLNWPRWAVTTLVVGVLAVLSIIFPFGWGMYILDFLDTFLANWSLLLIAFFELMGIAWIYGLATFSYDIKLMTGKKPNTYMMVCWKFLSPTVIVLMLVLDIYEKINKGFNYSPFDSTKGDFAAKRSYPKGIIALGFLLWIGIICWVPIQAILKIFGKSILQEEKPAYFPEEELRLERKMSDDEDDEFDAIDQLVMGKSIDNFKQYRDRSRSRASKDRSNNGSAMDLKDPNAAKAGDSTIA